MTDGKNTREPEHSTITFCIHGAMDDESAAEALRRLGAGVTLPAASAPPGGSISGKPGRWLACGLRSDGVIELWPAADPGGSPNGGSPTGGSPNGGSPNGGSPNGGAPSGGRLEDLLDSAGLPYELSCGFLPA